MSDVHAFFLGVVIAVFGGAIATSVGALAATVLPNLHKIRAAMSGRGWFGDA